MVGHLVPRLGLRQRYRYFVTLSRTHWGGFCLYRAQWCSFVGTYISAWEMEERFYGVVWRNGPNGCCQRYGYLGFIRPTSALEVVIFLLVSLPKQWISIYIDDAAISAILGTAVFATVIFLVPEAPPSDKDGKIDWIGVYLGVGG